MKSSAFANINSTEYYRARQSPSFGHPHYLHLSDMLMALESVIKEVQGNWLDYGSGASPYQFLFEGCSYHRADLNGENLDFIIKPGEQLSVPDAEFDGILSTQVIEHVFDPGVYLKDCWRILKPGGRLILTTHGIWKEHGAPHDYHRWTEWGLRAIISNAGFEISSLARVTCGPRVLLTLLNAPELTPRFGNAQILGKVIDCLFKLIADQRKKIHQISDKVHKDYRVVWDQQVPYYLVLMIVAEKST